MITIKAENVSKTIKGHKILNDISYNFSGSKIYGLHGRNGSGKTMLLRALSGLIYINSGDIKINEEILHKDISFPKSIGIIIEHTELLPQYSAYKNLKILSKIKNIVNDVDIKETIRRVGLDPSSNLPVKKFSLGMKQRLNIAQAILEKPEILLLDEPTNGIDTTGVELVRDILKQEKQRGALIIIASHNKEDISILADEILIMEDGILRNEQK